MAHVNQSIVSLEPNFVPSRIKQMRDRVKVRLNDVRGLLNGDVVLARNALLKHVAKIVLRDLLENTL